MNSRLVDTIKEYFRGKNKQYSDNIDFLIATIIYLGTHEFYWARTPNGLGAEINLDAKRLHEVFEGFPSIFRRSRIKGDNGQYYYALQARYAQREGGKTEEPKRDSYIAPLDKDKIDLLTKFVLQMVEHEKTEKRVLFSNFLSVAAMIISASAVIIAAILKK